jgi:hypothetical protein
MHKSFSEACEDVKIAMETLNMQVIHRYSNSIPWSFKFERRSKQYDPVDILYMSVFQTQSAPFNIEVAKLVNQGYDLDTLITLAQLSNGVWKRTQGTLRERYITAKIKFEHSTGISID